MDTGFTLITWLYWVKDTSQVKCPFRFIQSEMGTLNIKICRFCHEHIRCDRFVMFMSDIINTPTPTPENVTCVFLKLKVYNLLFNLKLTSHFMEPFVFINFQTSLPFIGVLITYHCFFSTQTSGHLKCKTFVSILN